MRNDVLFLDIYEGVQASEKYGKPDEYKPGKQHYGDANRQKVLMNAYTGWGHNTENLTSKSLEKNITATLTGSNESLRWVKMTGERVHKPLPSNTCQIPLQKAVAIRHADVVCRSFSVFS